MSTQDIITQRLYNQQISSNLFQTPGEVVGWFGAMQAQDYLGALWAIGTRIQKKHTEHAIEQAINEKQFVRTWPMRGTLHFVAPQDIRWMLHLMASRVIAGSTGRYRQLELNDEVFTQCKKILGKALEGNKRLTRTDIYTLLENKGIYVATTPIGSRGLHILGHLAMEGFICFGPREGKQQTFVLLDEWIQKTKEPSREEALTMIAKRYFTSHGPATLQDFVWWTGLTQADAKKGIEANGNQILQEKIGDETYRFVETEKIVTQNVTAAYLLPAFDEYTVSYKNRKIILDQEFAKKLNNGGGMLNPVIVIHGKVIGTWKRVLQKTSVDIQLFPFKKLSGQDVAAIPQAANEYATFLNLSVNRENI